MGVRGEAIVPRAGKTRAQSEERKATIRKFLKDESGAAAIEYGGQVGVQVFVRDITVRKQAEQERGHEHIGIEQERVFLLIRLVGMGIEPREAHGRVAVALAARGQDVEL